MSDLISRQAAIDALAKMMPKSYTPDGSHPADEEIFRAQEIFADCIKTLEILPSVQPEKRTEERTETHACDLIDREAAVDAIYHHLPSVSRTRARTMLHEVPSAQPEIIRCKDCEYWREDHTCREHSLVSPMAANEFCSRAERREK